jgi:hypothetical protein
MMVRAVTLAMFASLVFASSAQAQDPLGSFESLNERIKPGTIVFVTDEKGEPVKGKITELSAASLKLVTRDKHEQAMTFPPDRVSRVTRVDSRLNGFLIGAAAGAVPGILLGMGFSTYCENESTSCPLAPAVLGGIFGLAGGGIGYAIDGAIDGQRLVYSKMRARPPVGFSIRF